jgi:hypothetical protein
MSDHTTAFVPLESWCYNSPELRADNKSIDIGLMTEALIYYDCAIVNVHGPQQFAELLNWFITQNKYQDFLALVRDGVIKVYEYSFLSTAVNKDGVYMLFNLQDESQAQPNTFEQRILYHEAVRACLQKAKQRGKLYKTLRGNVIEVKANEFGKTVENAIQDFDDPERNALIVQAFVDELYKLRQLGRPPKIQANVMTSPDGGRRNVTWNVDMNSLAGIAGKELNFGIHTPLTAGAISNRIIWSAASLECDLYLGRPISVLVGDKLYESGRQADKAHSIIDELKERVEFPDIRQLTNHGQIGLDEILKIRKKARKFRDWLQEESDRDRDAIIAYHHEIAKEAGFVNVSRKALNLFGVIGGGAVGSLVGSVVAGPPGAALGGAAGSAVGYVMDVASKLGTDWKPMVFGTWFKNRIEELLEEKRHDRPNKQKSDVS